VQVRVLYFASLRDRVGLREEQLDLPEGVTIAELRSRLGERHAHLAPLLDTALFSVNREFAFPEERLSHADEVAVFPPVSGGAPPTILRLTEEALDLDELLAAIVRPTTGAACVFTGVVRAVTERAEHRETTRLEYEAYAPMAEAKLRQVAEEIRERWPSVEGIAIVQRLGNLEPGTPTLLIACTAAHRDSGVFEAARYGIDRLKEIVPIWKKEVGPGGESWVEGEYVPGDIDRRT